MTSIFKFRKDYFWNTVSDQRWNLVMELEDGDLSGVEECSVWVRGLGAEPPAPKAVAKRHTGRQRGPGAKPLEMFGVLKGL